MSWSAIRYSDTEFVRPRRFPSRRNRHHLIPRSLGGDNSRQNLLVINEEKHKLWHQLWGNRTIDEVLELLTRMSRAKKAQKIQRRKAA